jgi:hypothetical protein
MNANTNSATGGNEAVTGLLDFLITHNTQPLNQFIAQTQ